MIAKLSADLIYSQAELGYKSTPLGNFTADVLKDITGADFAIIRNTHITGGLSKNATAREANNVFMGNDSVEVRKITGGGLFKVMEIALNKLVSDENGKTDADKSHSDRFLQIAGFTVEYNLKYDPGKRIVKLTTDSGKSITQYTNKEYTIVSLSEIFDSYSEYLTSAEIVSTEEAVTEKLREYLKENQEITVSENERIKETDKNKSYMTIVLMIVACFVIAGIIAYIIAQVVMWFNVR